MRVTKRKSDGKMVYRSSPEFEEGFGIKNAVALEGGLPEDYEEVGIIQEEWEESLKPIPEQIKEAKIQAEMQKLLRDSAIASLKAKGEI